MIFFSRQFKLSEMSAAMLVAATDFRSTTDQHPNVTEQANIRAVQITDTAVLELNTAPVLDVWTTDQGQEWVRWGYILEFAENICKQKKSISIKLTFFDMNVTDGMFDGTGPLALLSPFSIM